MPNASWIDSAAFYHYDPSTSGNHWKCFVAWKCDSYFATAQTTNNQTLTVLSVPIPTSTIYDFDIIATFTNAAMDKGGRMQGTGTVARGAAGVFRPAAISLSSVKNLGNTSLDLVPNVPTQSADVQVICNSNTGGVINWNVWTIVRWSA